MWTSLLNAFGHLLSWCYDAIPNYGISIVLLTVAIRLVLYPLTAKQARSMAAMQRVQPEIKKLQQKYKDDRQKLNEELMAFYKEHQINPLSGCLPLVAQFPVFIALYQVLRKPAGHIPVGSKLFRAFCDHTPASACKPKGLGFLGLDLSHSASNIKGGFADALPYLVLIALVVGSGYLQSRQMSGLQEGKANPQTQIMGRVMPVFFGLISYSLPAGVVLYFLTSNVWQIGQQAVVFGKNAAAAPGPVTSGGEAQGPSTTKAPPASGPTAGTDGAEDGPTTSGASESGRAADRKRKRKRRR